MKNNRYRNSRRHTRLPRDYISSPYYEEKRSQCCGVNYVFSMTEKDTPQLEKGELRIQDYSHKTVEFYPFGRFCERKNYCSKCQYESCAIYQHKKRTQEMWEKWK